MPEIAVAVAQFAPGPDRAANLAEIERLADAAVARGARVVVLPEYASVFTPQPGPEWLEAAEGLDGPFATALAALAARLGIHLVAGLVEPAPGRGIDGHERVFNTAIAVAPTDGVVAAYRKLHLYDAFGQQESAWVAPGDIDAPETFLAGGIRFGIETCYDVRFPEVSRRIVDAGAEAVCMPAEWVRGPLKEHHWRTLVTARAIENTVYFVAADHAPPVGIGNSLIVDPMGVVLAGVGENAEVAVAAVSSERIAAVRELNPALALRRFDVR